MLQGHSNFRYLYCWSMCLYVIQEIATEIKLLLMETFRSEYKAKQFYVGPV